VMAFVHFEDSKGKIMFGQDHNIMKGYFDTTSPGYGAIKESYIIKVPVIPPDKKLTVYIGLYNPQTQNRIGVLNIITKASRVPLGRIFLQQGQ
jgi:hypothetical protein